MPRGIPGVQRLSVMPDERHAIDGSKMVTSVSLFDRNRMELAAHWHRCQNLPKKRVILHYYTGER